MLSWFVIVASLALGSTVDPEKSAACMNVVKASLHTREVEITATARRLGADRKKVQEKFIVESFFLCMDSITPHQIEKFSKWDGTDHENYSSINSYDLSLLKSEEDLQVSEEENAKFVAMADQSHLAKANRPPPTGLIGLLENLGAWKWLIGLAAAAGVVLCGYKAGNPSPKKFN